MEKFVKYDLSNSPILLAEIQPVEPTHENIDDYIETMKDHSFDAKEDNLIWINNLSKGKFLKSEFRIKFNDVWVAKNERDVVIFEKIKYIIYVNSSIVVSMILKTVLAFQKQLTPTKVFKTMDEAMDFAKKEVDKW